MAGSAMPGDRGMAEAAPSHERAEEPPWRLTPDLCLHLRRIGTQVAVYNEESGDTHLVTPWAAAILERLRRGCARPDDLDGLGPGPQAAAPQAVRRLLRDLRYLGLIEPVDR